MAGIKLRKKSYSLEETAELLNENLITNSDVTFGVFDLLRFIESKELPIWVEVDYRQDQQIYIQSGNSGGDGEYQLLAPKNEGLGVRVTSAFYHPELLFCAPIDTGDNIMEAPDKIGERIGASSMALCYRLTTKIKNILFWSPLPMMLDQNKDIALSFEGKITAPDILEKNGRLTLTQELSMKAFTAMFTYMADNLPLKEKVKQSAINVKNSNLVKLRSGMLLDVGEWMQPYPIEAEEIQVAPDEIIRNIKTARIEKPEDEFLASELDIDSVIWNDTYYMVANPFNASDDYPSLVFPVKQLFSKKEDILECIKNNKPKQIRVAPHLIAIAKVFYALQTKHKKRPTYLEVFKELRDNFEDYDDFNCILKKTHDQDFIEYRGRSSNSYVKQITKQNIKKMITHSKEKIPANS